MDGRLQKDAHVRTGLVGRELYKVDDQTLPRALSAVPDKDPSLE